MNRFGQTGAFLLRVAMAATLLSAVASRLGLWGKESSGWDNFLAYAAEVNSYVPHHFVPYLAIASTILETGFGLLLLVGYKTRWVALGASGLTLIFALSMAYSFGLKSPLDYSVFVDSTACFLLATYPSKSVWSLDAWLNKNVSVKPQ